MNRHPLLIICTATYLALMTLAAPGIITRAHGQRALAASADAPSAETSPRADSEEKKPGQKQSNSGQNISGEATTVIAPRVGDVERIKASPISTDIIDTADIPGGMNTLTEVLDRRVGLRTRKFGGLGSYSSLSIRGSDPGQVAFFRDGIPINDPRSGEVNLENLPLDNLERIEIYRGFTPARFGIAGIGGAVNLVTRKSKDYAVNTASATYGSFNTARVSLSRSQKIKNFDYLLYFSRASSDGDFSFINDRGTSEITGDDRRDRRRNNDHESYWATVKGGYTGEALSLSVMNDFFYKEQGVAGANNNDIAGMRLETITNIAAITLRVKKISSTPLAAEANCFYSLSRDDYENPRREYLGLSSTLSRKGQYDNAGVNLLWELALPRACQNITLLTAYRYETYRSREKSAYTLYEARWSPRQERHHAALTLEDEIVVLDDRLRIMPQFRYEYWGQFFSHARGMSTAQSSSPGEYHHFSGQLGLKYFIRDELYIKAGAGNAFRTPTFTELFGDGGYISGNASLKAEQSVNIDAGAGYVLEKKISVLDRISLEYAFFCSLVSDRIIMLNNSPHTMKAQNIDDAEITGHELSLTMGLFGHLDLGCSYTAMRALDKGKIPYYRGKYLPHRPVHEVSFFTGARSRYFACKYELSYIGANFRDRYNSAPLYLRQRLIHCINLQILPCRELTLSLDVKNMDNNGLRDLEGYPLPGISCYGTIEVKL
jgi:iron complex outermembrane receptor protein